MNKYRSILLLLIVCVALLLAGCGGGPSDGDTPFTVTRDVAYGEGAAHRFDAYVPQDASSRMPTVVLIHGGGFENGDKSQDFYIKMGETLAGYGYPAVSVNYTLVRLERTPAEQAVVSASAEILQAMDYIREHGDDLGIRSKEFVILGDSASGAIVSNMALDYGTDRSIIGCINMWGGMPSSTADTPWGGDVYTKQPDARRAPPFLLIHGTVDSIASYQNSVRFKALLDGAGIENQLIPLEGAEHYPEERAGEILPLIVSFLGDL